VSSRHPAHWSRSGARAGHWSHRRQSLGRPSSRSGHSKCSPGTCSSRNSKRLGSPSKRHWATRQCRPNPSAAVKSSSGVMFLMTTSLPKRQIPGHSPSGAFQKGFCGRQRAARNERRAVERKLQLPSQRGAKPAQARKGINGGGPRRGEEAVYAGFDLEQE
jgi:hypothetical protein